MKVKIVLGGVLALEVLCILVVYDDLGVLVVLRNLHLDLLSA